MPSFEQGKFVRDYKSNAQDQPPPSPSLLNLKAMYEDDRLHDDIAQQQQLMEYILVNFDENACEDWLRRSSVQTFVMQLMEDYRVTRETTGRYYNVQHGLQMAHFLFLLVQESSIKSYLTFEHQLVMMLTSLCYGYIVTHEGQIPPALETILFLQGTSENGFFSKFTPGQSGQMKEHIQELSMYLEQDNLDTNMIKERWDHAVPTLTSLRFLLQCASTSFHSRSWQCSHDKIAEFLVVHDHESRKSKLSQNFEEDDFSFSSTIARTCTWMDNTVLRYFQKLYQMWPNATNAGFLESIRANGLRWEFLYRAETTIFETLLQPTS